MRKLTAKPSGVNLVFPEGWEDITAEQFEPCDLILAQIESEDEDLNERAAVKKMTQILLQLTDLDLEKVKLLSSGEILILFDYLQKILTEPPEQKEFKSFEFRGDTWVMPEKNMTSSTYDEWMDCMTLEDLMGENEGRFMLMPKILAVLTRKPDEDWYNDEWFEERAEAFKQLDMGTLWQVFFFIRKRNKKLMKLLKTYQEASREESQKATSIDTVGIQAGGN